MATKNWTKSEIHALAKKQLASSSGCNNPAVIQAYATELKKHITVYPDDTLFVVRAQPGTGFGVVICLEDGCESAETVLTSRGRNDAGKDIGIGSLQEYRKHITQHPTHRANRLRRLKSSPKAGQTPRPSPNSSGSFSSGSPAIGDKPKRSGLLTALDRGTPKQSSPDIAVSLTKVLLESSLPVISSTYPMQEGNLIPSKRLSEGGPNGREDRSDDSDLDDEIRRVEDVFRTRTAQISPAPPHGALATPVSSARTKISPKKMKVDNTPVRTPFAQQDNNRMPGQPSTIAMTSAFQSAAPSASFILPVNMFDPQGSSLLPSMSAQEAKAKLQDVNEYMAAMIPYRRALGRRRLSSDIISRIQSADRGIAERRLLKVRYEEIIHAAQSAVTAVWSQPAVTAHLAVKAKQPAASSSRAGLPLNLPAPLQAQMKNDPIFLAMDRLSGTGDIPMHSLGGIGLVHQRDSDDDDPYDEDGDWYGRGKDRLRGPVAQAGDLSKFFHEAGNAEQFDTNESVGNALEKLGLPNLNTPFPGMDITLMPHQAIGVAWMLEKERGPNKGGILSDEMGLGKTVQMISTIMANRSEDPAVKTTLILAPLALLSQWKLEIEMKTNDRLTALIYHGSAKSKKRKDLQKYDVVLTTFQTLALEWPDPVADEKKEKQAIKRRKRNDSFVVSDSDDEVDRKTKKKKDPGILIHMKWFRIVLDEAQNIRNRRTRTSRAVTHLKSTYKWCLTGTPITNGLADVYPLLRFLQIRPWYDWVEFNGHVMSLERKLPSLATQRLQVILASCLLRRKKDTELDGKRLIELPSKDVQLYKLDMTPDEREIYNMVETRSQQVFNRYLRAGTVLKNYAQVLVMLLRLRQICSHTSLITEEDDVIIDDDLEHAKEEDRNQLIHAQTILGREFVRKVKAKLKELALERVKAESQSADATIENEDCPVCFDMLNDAVVTPCTHFFCKDCMNSVLAMPYVDDSERREGYKANERPCPVCRDPLCKERIFSRNIFEPTDEELSSKRAPDAKPEAKKKRRGGKSKTFVSKAGDDDDGDVEMPDIAMLLAKREYDGEDVEENTGEDTGDESDFEPKDNLRGDAKATATHKARGAGKGRLTRRVIDSDEDVEEQDDDDDLSDFIVHSDEDEEEMDARKALKKKLGKRPAREPIDLDEVIVKGDREKKFVNGPINVLSKLLPSTKMMFMMESLIKWQKEHPEEKTIVISQWTQCLELVSSYLTTKGFDHVKYQGDMSREKRDAAVKVFMQKDNVSVMLMSLKCGGVGLNLTRANRVISLDLGWSEAVESQAFDRVHRLGQTRSVVVQRLVIKDTVEDRVLAMQEKKKNLADGSLGEGNGQKIGRLSVRELAALFGLRV